MTSIPPKLSQSDTAVSIFGPWTSGESSSRTFTFIVTNTLSKGSPTLRFQTSILPVGTTTSPIIRISSSASTRSPSSPNFQTSTSARHTGNSPTSPSLNNQPHTPIIVGVLVGVFVFIVLLACTLIVWMRRSKRRDTVNSKEVKATKTKPPPLLGGSEDNSLEDRVTGYGQNDGGSAASIAVAASSRSRSHIIDLSSEMTESTGRPVASKYKTGQDMEERLNKVMQKLEIIEAAIQLHTHGWQLSRQERDNGGHNYPEASCSRGTMEANDRPPRYALNMDLATSSHWTTDIVNKDLSRLV